MKYRPDIQGLRAIAVVAVVLFHARLPVPGGFVGVDIFFVISGFVITGLLYREWKQYARIRFAQFYKRRFLRLTPALAIVIAFAVLGSGLLMFPYEQRVTIQTGIGALALVANVVIARTTGGYFDGPAENNPLLNTWSLSVEEQFYLFFPFALFASWWIARKFHSSRSTSIVVVGSIGLVSFGAALFSTTESGQGTTWLNFYSPAVRVWEFAAGSLLFLIMERAKYRASAVATLLGIFGVLGIAYSLLFINNQTPFPSAWTLIPVLATMLLIAAGTLGANIFSKLLSTKPFIKLGDWSYSIYLWHWPLIVFIAFLGFDSPVILGCVALLSLIPAVISYKVIENPIRNRKEQGKRYFPKVALATISVPLAAVLAVTFFIHPRDSYPNGDAQKYLEFITTNSVPCEISQAPGNLSRCRQTRPGEPIQLAVIGDSHGEHLFPGLIETLPDINILYVYLPDWPYKEDENTVVSIAEIANDRSIETVIISARWFPEAENLPTLRETIEAFAISGKNLLISTDNPYFSFDAQECKYERPLFLPQQCNEESTDINEFMQVNLDWLNKISSQFQNVELLDTSSGFCAEGLCGMVVGDTLMYADRGHLNVDGSRFVIGRSLPLLSNLYPADRDLLPTTVFKKHAT